MIQVVFYSAHPVVKESGRHANELVGKQLIDSFFEQLYATATVARHKIQFTIFGDCVYTQDEIARDLWYLLHECRTVFQVVRHELEAESSFQRF